MAWVSVILFLAAVYNIVWGALAAAVPVEMLAWAGIDDARYPEFWQCIGMMVGLYGVAYWLASRDPLRYWPIVAIGLAGKILGPIGAILGVAAGRLPTSFLWINLANDFVWWVPFAWALYSIRKEAARQSSTIPLYPRLLGAAFHDLSPQVRRFHNTVEPMEVRGLFDVKRGGGTLANWLTDRAGFPRSQDGLAVKLVVEPHAGGETWWRSFAGQVIRSRQFAAHDLLAERFGPLVLYLRPRVKAGALEIHDVRSTVFGIPLPPVLAPRVDAFGIDNGSGIDVAVRLSCMPLGLLVEYRGTVALN